MMKLLMSTVAAIVVFTAAADLKTEGVPQQELAAAFVPKVQTPNEDTDVTLARFSFISGRHRNVYGFDFGVLGNLTKNDMIGFAVSGLFNHVGSSSGAIQIAGIFNYSRENLYGMQVAVANYAMGECIGAQIAAINVAGTLSGMQVGAFNKAHVGDGLQLGAINVSDQLTGVQIGLININHDSSVRMAPVFNCYF